ncbi:GNAT family N-acetyltransferase [Roseomonas sp. CECT 9278]|uniref:GNAT family N-acetyltransferase n=1 Tax=Roseomonas sp. CECT 9278 TaxID=2845823 RepID=UPI001E618FD0|nr:GNAT family N-acetyltransferase [Roseomonas sp. CECT 9278]CAH0222402.1 Acetyltransferase [Roseomonas sp. CECT 9278]
MDTSTLQTARLLLRPWRPEDLAPLFAINGDAQSMRHFASPMTRAESDAWAERMQTHMEAHGWGFWVVEERGGAPFVGVVGLMNIPWQARFTPAVEIGWRIAPGFRRRGHAEEAARAALDFGFGTLGLAEVVAFTVPGNAASWRLMERLGMRADGEFDHPRLPAGHPLRRHLLYRATPGQRLAAGGPGATRD